MARKSYKPLLTVADVVAMRDEIEALKRDIKTANIKLVAGERRLSAALEFLPEGTDLAALKVRRAKTGAAPKGARKASKATSLPLLDLPTPKAKSNGKRKRKGGRRASLSPSTWKGAVMHVLNAAGKGLTHAAIIAGLQQTPLAKTANDNRKGYYNAVGRLETQDKLIERHGSLIYSVAVAEFLKKNGPLPDQDPSQPTKPRGQPSTRDHVKAILVDNPHGLDGPAILDALGKREGVTKSVKDHPHFVYTLLGKMMEDNEVVREDRIYRLRGPVEVKSGPVVRTTDPLH